MNIFTYMAFCKDMVNGCWTIMAPNLIINLFILFHINNFTYPLTANYTFLVHCFMYVCDNI